MGVIVIGVLAFVGVIFLAVGAYGIGIFNGLVALKNQVERSWANIDVILKQRHDEIPNLVSVCEQFAGFERATLDRVMQARERYGSARTLGDKVQAATALSGALQGLFALSEAYPQLKSSEHFHQLQTRISALENTIADRREMFNETVTNHNTRISQFPDMFFANMLGYRQLEHFKVAEIEKAMPSVKMKLPA